MANTWGIFNFDVVSSSVLYMLIAYHFERTEFIKTRRTVLPGTICFIY